jgi:flagellar hook assembly protein FlgD/outer membrane protein OmpA-like peptidoglycan-associated protein
MSFFKRTLVAVIVAAFACASAVFGYDPPKGGVFLPSIYSPWGLASTPTVTGDPSPWAAMMNPSATGGTQLTQFEAAYTGVSDFKAGGQGWGSAASLSFSLPVPYGVWGGGARFFSVPGTMTGMPLGTFGSIRGSFSKDLFPNLYIGSALDITMGGNGSFGWGVGLDLGATWFAGNLGFLKDTRFGLSILNIGKGYAAAPITGIFGGTASSYPSAFTLGLGMRSYLLQTYNWNLDVAVDLWSPSFQDLGLGLSVGLGFRDFASLRLGWSVGLRDAIAGSGRSYLPALGLSGTIPLGKGFALGKNRYKDASIGVAASAAPLYDGLFAIGAGFNLSFGVKDKSAPVIDAKLPVAFRGVEYISPNEDGQKDKLEIPVKITDERYIAGWELKIEDKSSGKVFRTIGASDDRPDSITGLAALGQAFIYTRKGIEIPESIVWDGRDDKGAKVPDGSYTVSLSAVDDNGNTNLDYMSCMVVVVDQESPEPLAKPVDALRMIFSPDSDGSRDSFTLRNSKRNANGKESDEWKAEIVNAEGKAVRTRKENGTAPSDFTWDGTDNEGKRVPDGAYSFRLSSRDEAGNQASSEVRGIVVNTSKPAVSIAADETVISPNGDGSRDSLHIVSSVESFEGLESWTIVVRDEERRNQWTVSGAGDSRPSASYLFAGRSDKGESLADGQYEASIKLEYVNGYAPEKLSAPFYIDKTPPSATIALADATTVFSPDGDGSRDNFTFAFSGTEEDTWNLVIRDGKKNEKLVRRYAQALPEALEWNGKDDQGRVVPDGDYEVYVFAVDKAGNSFAATSKSVRVDTRRPTIALTPDKEAFSPNGDGVAESAVIIPAISTTEGLVSWSLSILASEKDAPVGLTFSGDGTELPASRYVFDGRGGDGSALPEGAYRAKLDVAYINGYRASAESPDVILDRTFPKAQAKLDRTSFNPAGSAGQAKLAIAQSGSAEESWTGRILDASGVTLKRWTFVGEPETIAWDGLSDGGLAVPDGTYRYVISATDRAGNAFSSAALPFEIDTLRKEAKLAADSAAFSPNGDGVKDRLSFAAEATAAAKLTSWSLRVTPADADGAAATQAVKSWQGAANMPRVFEWNGQTDAGVSAPDGAYRAALKLTYANGDSAEAAVGPFIVDRIAPRASVKASNALFSPNGDGVLDSVTFAQEGSSGDVYLGAMKNARGEEVARWTWTDAPASFTWDGTDSSQGQVADGDYYYELASSDAAGNRYASGKVKVTIETEKKSVRLDLDRRAFSPNGDGYRDELAIGIAVLAPEKVKAHELRIVAQEGPMAMTTVRQWKGSGPIPQRAVWRGETDSGVQAPDGRYAVSATVNYMNGDEVEASAPTVLMDRVFPKIEVSASLEMFSPNGDGRSDTVDIRQTSVSGDDWVGSLRAADGKIVKSYTWQGEARSFTWDGRDNTGATVRDGVYRYGAESVDGAGNKTSSPEIAIAVETEKKAVRLDVNTLAFSPNGDGKKDSVTLGVSAQYPERLKSFELLIVQNGADASALPVRSWKGSTDIRGQYAWDGTTDSGIPAPEGAYRAVLSVLYKNDDAARSEVGPFILDRVAPQATVRLSSAIFSPNGDGRSDTVSITQDSVPGDDWQGQIISSADKIVKTWSWNGKVESVAWDGRNQAGAAVPDGLYYYELRSIDKADNSFVSERLPVEVDAAKKTVRLDVDQKAFSPNGDGVKDALYINIQAPRTQTLREYEVTVYGLDAAGKRQANPVRAWRGAAGDGAGLQDQYVWDGRTDSGIMAPDGSYMAAMRLLYNNDDAFSLAGTPVVLDTVAPRIAASTAAKLFSPNGDGNKDTLAITQNSSVGDDWTGRVRNASGAAVRTWTWKNEARSFVWDGKDASGAFVRDGAYTYDVSATDAAGNTASARIDGIMVDATRPRVFVTTSDNGMSPNGDGVRDEVSFTLVVEQREGIESWRFSLLDRQGVEKSFFGGTGSEVPARLVWDGRDLQGNILQGDYSGKLVVRYEKGDVAQATSSSVLVDVDPPSVSIKVDPEYFSPDGDGVGDKLSFFVDVDAAAGIVDWKLEVNEQAVVESSNPNAMSSERLFVQWSGKGKPAARIDWDGKSARGELVEAATDYPFKFVAHDALGNSTTVSGVIAVDVLVIRDGDRLKIKIPSIVFRANYADFVGLSSDIVARNEKVVERVAQILNKFPDYRILIEGHANNVGKMLGYPQAKIDAEETKELIPLSAGRAELVRAMLVKYGVDARRLSVEGLGSSKPVVSFSDVENRWKNRRVEFVLIKN